MDIFNSALKNTGSSSKREQGGSGTDSETSIPLNGDTSASDARVGKKKNSRRKHRNSHLGCGTCKKRRIKCDENLPSCLNCLKGKLNCAYLNLDGPARNALRMAQYNQNVRQDKLQQESSIVDASGLGGAPPTIITGGGQIAMSATGSNQAPVNTVSDQVLQYQTSGQPATQTFAVPYPVIQSSMSIPAPQQTAHVIQSPYGPLVSLQPITTIPTYSSIPVQGIPQQVSHVIYPQHPNGPIQQISIQAPQMQQIPQQVTSIPVQQSQVKMEAAKDELILPSLSNNMNQSNPNSLRTSPKLSSLSTSHSYTSLPFVGISQEQPKKEMTPILPPPIQSMNSDRSTSQSLSSDIEKYNTLPSPKTTEIDIEESNDSKTKIPKISKLLS